MNFEQYLEAIGGRCDSVSSAATGFDSSKTTYRDICGETVATVGGYEIAKCGEDFHAFTTEGEEDRESVGYLLVERNQTDLAVSDEHCGNGIGYTLMLVFRRSQPMHSAGCVSCSGERLLRKVFATLQGEGVL